MFCYLLSVPVFSQGNVPTIEWYDSSIPHEYCKSIPEALKKPDDIQSLTLETVSTKEEFKQICTLKNLKILVMRKLAIDSIPTEIKNLTKLQFLQIENSPITYLPDEIKFLTDLRTLHILRCPLKQINPLLFDLLKLRTIKMDSTNVSVIPAEIGRSKLQMFSIGRSKVEVIPPELCQVQSLYVISVSGCKIKTIPACIAGLSSLMTLSLVSNEIREVSRTLLSAPKLEFLYLIENPIPWGNRIEPEKGSVLSVFY